MEEDLTPGATSFSNIDLDAPKSEFGKYLDTMCPYFMSWGMTWEEFWFESIERFAAYWQANEFNKERRNEELWWQGVYIRMAVASCLDSKGKIKYPEKPYRITEMTDAERQYENQRRVEEMREMLMEHKRRWDAKHNGVDAV